MAILSCVNIDAQTDTEALNDYVYEDRTVRFFMKNGDTIDYDAEDIDSITSTIEFHRIWKNGAATNVYISDIDSIWYMVPRLGVSSERLNYGTVALDETKIRTLSITNNNSFPETVSISDCKNFTRSIGDSQIVLGPNETISIDFIYTPKRIEEIENTIRITSPSFIKGYKEVVLTAQSKEPVIFPDIPTVSQRAYEEHNVFGDFKMNDNSVFIRQDVSSNLVSFDEENKVLVFDNSDVLESLDIKPGNIIYSTELTELFPDGYCFRVLDYQIKEDTRGSASIRHEAVPTGPIPNRVFVFVEDAEARDAIETANKCYPIQPMNVEKNSIVFYDVTDQFNVDLLDNLNVDHTWSPLSDATGIKFSKDGDKWTGTYQDKITIVWDNKKDQLDLTYVLWSSDDGKQKLTAKGFANFNFGEGVKYEFSNGQYLVDGDFTYDLSCELEYSTKIGSKASKADQELLDRLKKQIVGKRFKLVDLEIPLPWGINAVLKPKLQILVKFNADLNGKLTAHYDFGGETIHYHFANSEPYGILPETPILKTTSKNLNKDFWIKGSIEGKVAMEVDMGFAVEIPKLSMEWYDNSQVKSWKNYNKKKEKLNSFVGLYLTLGFEGVAKIAAQTNFSTSEVSASINPTLTIGALAEGAIGYKSKPLFCDQVTYDLLKLDFGTYKWSINNDQERIGLLSPQNGKFFTDATSIKLMWDVSKVSDELTSYKVYVGKNPDKLELYSSASTNSILFIPNSYGTYYWYVTGTTKQGVIVESFVYNFNVQPPVEYVDLGLPSGTKWATANLGAIMPWDKGDVYAWGAIVANNSPYDWATYKWAHGSYNSLSKYCTNSSFGKVDNKLELEPADDPVYKKKSGRWHIPTAKEFDELRTYCKWEWVENYGGKGCWKITGNKQFIYLPVTGYYHDSNYINPNTEGYYWTSSLYSDHPSSALCYHFTSSTVAKSNEGRENGMFIRPVYSIPAEPEEVSAVKLDIVKMTMIPGVESKLSCSWVPDYVAPEEASITWVSTDPTVATVANGIIKAIKPGKTVIRAIANGGAEAECVVTVKSATKDHYIAIEQYSYKVPADGGNIQVSYRSDVPCTFASSASWVSVNGSTLKVSGNPTTKNRTATITIKNVSYGLSETISITQSASSTQHYLNVSKSTYSVPAVGGNVTIDYNSDVACTLTSSVTWLTISGNKVIVSENTNTKSRTGAVTIRNSSCGLSETITITQEAGIQHYLNVTKLSYNVPAKGERFKIEFSSDVSCIISESVDWIAIGDEGYVTVLANTTNTKRSAAITIRNTTHDLFKSVTIEQEVYRYSAAETLEPEINGTTVTLKGMHVCWGTDVHGFIYWEKGDAANTTQIVNAKDDGEYFSTTIDLKPECNYIVQAMCNLSETPWFGNKIEFTTSTSSSEVDGTHEYVDLGLPSGTLWATCNVGANSPEEAGGYYAWGEKEEKSYYSWDNYILSDEHGLSFYKYCTDKNRGTVDNKTTLELDDDVAYVKLGKNWRMPNGEEIDELLKSCSWEWESRNGVYGQKITGPNGNSIFMPATGFHSSGPISVGSCGCYWSSSLNKEDNKCAISLFFDSGNDFNSQFAMDWRRYGFSVRPIYKKVGIDGQVVLERKYKVHHGGRYNETHIDVAFSDDMFLRIAYLKTDYWQSYDHSIEGVNILTKSAWHNVVNTEDIWRVAPLVVDEWVKEKVVINSDGLVEYYMNDKYVGKYKFREIDLSKAEYVQINMSPYGWWTNHSHYMDDFVLTTPAGTYRDNFDDGVLDSNIWLSPLNPNGVREEDGIVKAEQIKTDVDFTLRSKQFRCYK